MLLPLREYTQVVSSLKERGAGFAADEARKSPRVAVVTQIDVHVLQAGKVERSFTALTRDLSRGGLGLIQSVDLPKGQEVVVTLPREAGPIRALARVVRSVNLADGIYLVGIEFLAMGEKTEPATGDAPALAKVA